jgi:hypothetical protein
MFSVKYKGKQVSLGRFGEVESGDVIRLTTYEYANVKDDDDFSLVKADEYAKVKPLATPLFNLQRLAGVSKLYQTLDAMNTHMLSRVCAAINLCGGKLSYDGAIKAELVDHIMSTAMVSKWDEYTKESLAKLPVIKEEQPEPIQFDEEEKTEGDSNEKVADDETADNVAQPATPNAELTLEPTVAEKPPTKRSRSQSKK